MSNRKQPRSRSRNLDWSNKPTNNNDNDNDTKPNISTYNDINIDNITDQDKHKGLESSGNGVLMSGCIPCHEENLVMESKINKYINFTIESATPGTMICLLCPFVVLCCPFLTTMTDPAYYFNFYKVDNEPK